MAIFTIAIYVMLVDASLAVVRAAIMNSLTLLWRGALAAPDGRLHLVIFDIDGSQTLLLRGPGGETLLANGGPSAVLERYPPGLALWGCLAPDNPTGDRLVSTLEDGDVQVYPIATGKNLALGSEARLQVLARSDEGSVLIRYVYCDVDQVRGGRRGVVISVGVADGERGGSRAQALDLFRAPIAPVDRQRQAVLRAGVRDAAANRDAAAFIVCCWTVLHCILPSAGATLLASMVWLAVPSPPS